MNFQWDKRGKIFQCDKSLEWSQTHSTLPTPYILSKKVLRIFFTSRDSEQKSRISYIDVNPENPLEILYINPVPILELGTIGMFDDRGMTSSYILPIKDKLFFYFNGYNIGMPARYRIAIGLAVSDLNASKFKKFSEGPILDRSISDPCGCATPTIIYDKGIYKMWYSSFRKWEIIQGEAEPYYNIAYAESKDAIHWVPFNLTCIDFRANEGGIVRPSVIKLKDTYYMWYSVRKNTNYRKNISSSYRLGFAVSSNGISWDRLDDEVGISLSLEGWDSEMVCYPFVIRQGNKLYMFYNGNGFGQSGFGYAVCRLDGKNEG